MSNVSDSIEKHLLELLEYSPDGVLTITRGMLCEQFACVPSQINYVIGTRFTLAKGYMVDSKRGGGGYIRIQRLSMDSVLELHEELHGDWVNGLSQSRAEAMINKLRNGETITAREASLMQSAVAREVLDLPLPIRDLIRARILRAMLVALLRE